MDRELDFYYPKKQPVKVVGKPVRLATENHSAISSIAYDPEGKALAVAGYDGSIKIYNPTTGKVTQVLSTVNASENQQQASGSNQ